jgi:hypothetical protein
MGDRATAERARIEAHAQAPAAERLAKLLVGATNAAERARVLSEAVQRGAALERPDAATLEELGRIEVDALGQRAEGVAHLRLALALAPSSHEARAALAVGLAHAGSTSEAVALLTPMLAPDPAPLLSLRDAASALATLDRALTAESRSDEALVVRELRAIAGGLDDGAHVELRARRLAIDPAAPVPIALDAATMRSAVVPPSAPALLLDLAAALAGIEGKIVDVDLEALVGPPRTRMPAPDAIRLAVRRLATLLGLAWPEIVVTDRTPRPRIVVREPACLIVPAAVLDRPDPVQTAMLAPPLVRLALGVPWLDDPEGPDACSVVLAAAHAAGLPDGPSDEIARRVGRAIGRKQKKALAELGPALAASPPTLDHVVRLEHAIACAGLRAAFVATGDLLATLDAARASDATLDQATSNVGPTALAAVLRHPIVGDLVQFGLAQSTLRLRWRAGTLWQLGGAR